MWCKGSTTDFDSVCVGSNPAIVTTKIKYMQIKLWQKVLFFGSITAFVLYYKRDTIKKLFDFGDISKKIAEKWVGIKEIGNNKAFSNDVFQSMMRAVGWSSNEQWCMYFAKAIHYDAYKDRPEVQAKIKKILNGRTQESYVNAKNDKTGTYTVVTEPKVGDILIFQKSTDKSRGHAGVVIAVEGNNVKTIEGNTSDKNIADGDLVARKTRPKKIGAGIGDNLYVRGFIRKLDEA